MVTARPRRPVTRPAGVPGAGVPAPGTAASRMTFVVLLFIASRRGSSPGGGRGGLMRRGAQTGHGRRSAVRAAAALVSVALLAVVGGGTPAYAAYGRIEGAGSTWSQVIVDRWIADVSANGMTVTYSGGGSSVGRQRFGAGITDFGVTEIPYQGIDQITGQPDSTTREFAYLPIVAGGTAFTYHLEQGGTLIRDVRLSGETIAKIFTNQITSWADPQIKADNNGRAFPDTPITPVVRSDGSGTTWHLTKWMDTVNPAAWQGYRGTSGATPYWPRQGGQVAASGSDQVMNTIAAASGNGTIGYIEYSYPVNKGFPVVKVLNAAGYYVEPTQYAVAVALTKAQINHDESSDLYLTQVLDGVYTNPDPRAYPLSSYSYMLLPVGANDSRMSTNKRQTLVDFMFYSLCEGQSKAGPYGYSPLPLNLVQAGFEQVARLGTADAGVDVTNRDASHCDNPTFVAGDLTRDLLAEIATLPPACDLQGHGPCPDGDPGEPGESADLGLELLVPELSGALVLGADLSAPTVLQARYVPGLPYAVADGDLPDIEVLDTRQDDLLAPWEVQIQATDLAGEAGVIGAEYVGMRPTTGIIDGIAVVEPGPEVLSHGSSPDSPGLSVPQTLVTVSTPGRVGVNITTHLTIDVPLTAAVEGTYTGTVTVTLISS